MRLFQRSAAGAAAAAIALFLTIGSSKADLITFKFAGVVSSIAQDPASPLPAPWNGVAAGDPWSVTYTFETTTPNSSLDPNFGQYRPFAGYGLTIGSNLEAGLSNTGVIQVFGNS